MEQVLSSPRGHSDWESDQNLLGFLLLDNDDDDAAENGRENPERLQRGEPGIVSLSFDEIFQESSLNLDELFRASRYSGLDQPYPWERTSDSVGPSWDKQQALPQKLGEKDCSETPHDGLTADLISFNSSPTHTCTSGTVTTDCPSDGLIDLLALDPMLDQTHSQTLPNQRTSGVEESPDSHWTSSQTTPENVTDLLCANLTDVVEESASTRASCNETSVPLPCVHNLSSSPLCSVPQPDSSDELSPSLFLEPAVQPCSSSHAILQTAETTSAGVSDTPSIGNTPSDYASEVRSGPQSPVSPLASSKLSAQERTLAGSDSEAQPETPLKSLTTDGPPESSALGFTLTPPVSLSPQTHFSPESSNDELCVNTLGSETDTEYETSCDLNQNSDLSVTFASEEGIVVDTFPALEKDPPPVSPSVCLTVEVNADSESQTRTSTESEHNPSESTNSPEEPGEEQTISLHDVDTSDTVTRTLAAVDTHLLLHTQEEASVHTSVRGTTQHCRDPNGCTADVNQKPNAWDESCTNTPERNVHITSDDSQDSHTLTESSDGSVDTHTPVSPVSVKNNTPTCATLPTPGSPRAEVTCVQSVSGPLDPTLLSGAESPLGQVGVATEQEMGEATSRVGQSADARVDGETDLPDRADLSQVAQPKVNPLGDESPGGVGPLEETCPPPMEENVAAVPPDGPSNAEMALELCMSSDSIQDDDCGAGPVPADGPQDEEHSALRAVFQALDQDGDGFVRIEEFMGFAMAYGVEQVMSLLLYIYLYKCLHV